MKDCDEWNELKKRIEAEEDDPKKFPKEGEVWMCSVGRNIGYEQNGAGDNFSRPVLVVKKFNNHMFWAVSLSTKQKDFDFYFNYTDVHNAKVSAILAQLKLVSVKRLKRKLYELSSELFEEMRARLRSYLKKIETPHVAGFLGAFRRFVLPLYQALRRCQATRAGTRYRGRLS